MRISCCILFLQILFLGAPLAVTARRRLHRQRGSSSGTNGFEEFNDQRRVEEDEYDDDYYYEKGKGKGDYAPSSSSPTQKMTPQPTFAPNPPPTPGLPILPTQKPFSEPPTQNIAVSPASPPASDPTNASVGNPSSPVASTSSPVGNSSYISNGPTPAFATPPTRAVIIPGTQEAIDYVLGTVITTLEPYEYDYSMVISNTSSYQYQALTHVSKLFNIDILSMNKIVQYWLLYCIYFATSGPGIKDIDDSVEQDTVFSRQDDVNNSNKVSNNTSKSGWDKRWGWESFDQDPCLDEWFGINCDDLGQVTEVRLQRNRLNGIFPFRDVVFLASSGPFHIDGVGNLQVLEIYNNPDLSIDTENHLWIESLDGLQILNYRHTSFTGPIPKLPLTLKELDCSYTKHSGPIPSESFNHLTDLELANLDGNAYISSVPTALATLPNLKFLYIRDASLTGNLAYMEGMTSIVEHAVDNNPGITGSLYPFTGRLYTLRSLSISDCNLTGTLPKELATAGGKLVQLWLHGNKLSGTIPSEYSTILDLRILTLEDNNLSGTMPIDICLDRFDGELTSLSSDCEEEVDCSAFFPGCCTCCGRLQCGS